MKKFFFIFHIPRWTGFLMILLTTLCDDYIDRPKLSEQKNPFDYIVPLPLKWVGTTTTVEMYSSTSKAVRLAF